jgi:hypothetical protein
VGYVRLIAQALGVGKRRSLVLFELSPRETLHLGCPWAMCLTECRMKLLVIGARVAVLAPTRVRTYFGRTRQAVLSDASRV